MHGLASIWAGGKFRRTFWFVTCAVAVFYAVSFSRQEQRVWDNPLLTRAFVVRDTVNNYLDHAKSTSLTSSYASGGLKLPDITVCGSATSENGAFDLPPLEFAPFFTGWTPLSMSADNKSMARWNAGTGNLAWKEFFPATHTETVNATRCLQLKVSDSTRTVKGPGMSESVQVFVDLWRCIADHI